uniref:Uncharacterized protein n=1 Tax=Romanomermis culicivorax TaxID=13658 RepID=A0A915K6G9_ROMCU
MKSDYQIAETLALTPLYSLPNHHKWMNAVRGTRPLVAYVCSPHSETELRAIIKNEIPKLMWKSDSIDIDLICQQNWVKRDGTFELELIESANRLPYNEKNRSDSKRPVYANRYFM